MNTNQNVTVSTRSAPHVPEWIGDSTRYYVELVCYAYLSLIVGLFGTVTNILNFSVFFKHGLKDDMNFKLAALTATDFGICVFTLVFSLFNYIRQYHKIVFSEAWVIYVFSWPMLPLSRTAGCITVLITVERCFCIIFPLKVKSIFTQKVVNSVLFIFFILFLAIMLPTYFSFTFETMVINNKTHFDIEYKKDVALYNGMSKYVAIFTKIVSYVAMVTFTAFLIHGLRKQSARRREMKTPGNSSSRDQVQSVRDDRVVKMVVLIAVILIVFSFPDLVSGTLNISVPGMAFGAPQENTYRSILAVAALSRSINSSVNIFVYVNMNHLFKQTLWQMFCILPSS